MKEHKRYLKGFYYKGSSYHEFRFSFGRTLMIRRKGKSTTHKVMIYKEWKKG